MRRDGQWRTLGVENFPGEQAFQDQKRGENRVKRSVQTSQRLADGRGLGTCRVMGNYPGKSLNDGTGIDKM